MPRDDFSLKTKQILANRVACICSNLKCRTITMGPHTNPKKYITIGVAGHITAASPKGPRYDRELTPLERKSPENGIWLCQNCGKLVDSDNSKFTKQELLQWKQQAEDEQFNKVAKILLPFNKITDEEEKIKLLKILMTKSEAGFHTNITPSEINTATGTIGFIYFPVTYKQDIKILDLIGGINKNRISIIMQNKNIIELIIYDALGNKHSVKSKLSKSKFAEFIFLTWNQKNIAVWYKGEIIFQLELDQQLRDKWAAITSGLDIDGSSRANYIIRGAKGGGRIGLGLCSSDKSLQVIISHLIFLNRVISSEEILDLTALSKS